MSTPTGPEWGPFDADPTPSRPRSGGLPTEPTVRFGGAGPLAFSITAPATLSVSDGRGTTQFTVTNLTGRPVRARLLPQALQGADQSWLQLLGEPEVPIPVGGTVTVAVAVAAPATAPGGSYLVRLDAVPEDDTEALVVGPAAAFVLPPPAPPPTESKRRWLVPLIIGVVVVVLAAGVGTFLLTRPKTPQNLVLPQITGTEPAAVGDALTTTSGEWRRAKVVQLQWQRCLLDSCTDIQGATGVDYDVADADLGQELRVVAVGWQESDGTGLSTRVESARFAIATRPATPVFTPRFPARSAYGPDPNYRADVIRVALEGGRLVVSIEATGPPDLRRPETSCVQVVDQAGAQIATLAVAAWQPTLEQPTHYQGDLEFDPGSMPLGDYLFRYSCAPDYTAAKIGAARAG